MIDVKNSEFRNTTLDIAKGISILLMTISHLQVFNHYPSLQLINEEFFSIFKMPLFVIISGMLLSTKSKISDFFIKKSDGLLKPTFFLFSLSILSMFLYKILIKKIFPEDSDFILAALGIFFPLWFVVALYISQLIFFILIKIKNPKYLVAVTSIVVLGLYFLQFNNVEISNFKFHTILSFMVYLTIGFAMKKYIPLNKILGVDCFAYFLLIFLIATSFKDNLNISLNLFIGVYGGFVPTLISSIVGVFLVLNISNLIERFNFLPDFLIVCSKCSFFILAFHLPVESIILNVINLIGLDRNIIIDSIFYMITIFICISIYFIVAKIPYLNSVMLPKKVIVQKSI